MKRINRFLVFFTPFIIIGIIIIIFIIFSNIQYGDAKCLENSKNIILILFGIMVSLIPINFYYVSSSKIEYETFTNCNRRFDEINEDLNDILEEFIDFEEKFEIENYKKEQKKSYNIILNYLDLCAEEYYLYKHQGIVSNTVWKHWFNGIKYYFDYNEGKNIFYYVLKKEKGKNERNKDSYYGFLEYYEKMKTKGKSF
jgi:hypothetical protein